MKTVLALSLVAFSAFGQSAFNKPVTQDELRRAQEEMRRSNKEMQNRLDEAERRARAAEMLPPVNPRMIPRASAVPNDDVISYAPNGAPSFLPSRFYEFRDIDPSMLSGVAETLFSNEVTAAKKAKAYGFAWYQYSVEQSKKNGTPPPQPLPSIVEAKPGTTEYVNLWLNDKASNINPYSGKFLSGPFKGKTPMEARVILVTEFANDKSRGHSLNTPSMAISQDEWREKFKATPKK